MSGATPSLANGRAPAFRLLDTEAAIEPVLLPSGREVEVRPLTRAGHLMRARLVETGNDDLWWELAALCLPAATAEEIESLTANMCMAVIGMARGRADEVLALLGKSPADPDQPAPDSLPTT